MRRRILVSTVMMIMLSCLCACGNRQPDIDEETEEITDEQDDSEDGTDSKEKQTETEESKPDYATIYLSAINELYITGKADRFELMDIDGDDIPELAAAESAETYYYDNAYLYTIKEEKPCLIKSLVSGVDGIHMYISNEDDLMYCTSWLSGSEDSNLYRIVDGELKPEKEYEALYDFENDSYIYNINKKEVSEEEYYDDLEKMYESANPFVAIDCNGLNETEFKVSVDDSNSKYIDANTVKTKEYRSLSQIRDYLVSLGAKPEEESEDWISAYKKKISEFYDEHRSEETEYANVKFGLVFFDNDNIPELVAGLDSYYVSLYTYKDDEVTPIFEDWGYGIGGNPGYDYCPREGVIYNMNNDFAGLMVWETYMKYDPKSGELKDMNDKEMSFWFVEDPNGDGFIDSDETEKVEYLEEPIYYYGDDRVSKEEYESHAFKGEFDSLIGYKSYGEMMSYIDGLSDSGKDSADYHDTYETLLKEFLRESDYDSYKYVLDGIGDAVVYSPDRNFRFAFKDINDDGVEEMFINDHLFIADEDWETAYLGPCFGFFDEKNNIIVQTYSMDGYEDPSDTYFELKDNKLTEVKSIREQYHYENDTTDYFVKYPDGKEEQISYIDAMAMRPPSVKLDYYPLTEEGILEYFGH